MLQLSQTSEQYPTFPEWRINSKILFSVVPGTILDLQLAVVNYFVKFLKISVLYRKVLYDVHSGCSRKRSIFDYMLNIIRRPDSGGSLLYPPRGDGQHHLSPALLLSRWAQHGNNATVNEEGR